MKRGIFVSAIVLSCTVPAFAEDSPSLLQLVVREVLPDVIVPIGILFVALWAIKISINAQRRDFLFKIIERFSEDEIGKAIQQLWLFFKNDCKKDRDELKRVYIERYQKDEALHFARRKVSHYYQLVGTAYCHCMVSKRVFKKMWSNYDCKTFWEIILPIEEALAYKTGQPILPGSKTDLARMMCQELHRLHLPEESRTAQSAPSSATSFSDDSPV